MTLWVTLNRIENACMLEWLERLTEVWGAFWIRWNDEGLVRQYAGHLYQ